MEIEGVVLVKSKYMKSDVFFFSFLSLVSNFFLSFHRVFG